MAAPIAGKVQLPTDAGNTGPKVRTRSRTVGSDTVHEHYFVISKDGAVLGVNSVQLPIQSVQASAQNATSTGFLWISVPIAVGSAKKARIRRVVLEHQVSGITSMPTNPRIVLARYTFTGTASGASLTPAQVDPSGASPVADFRTAVTGMTVSLGAILCGTFPVSLIASGTIGDVETVYSIDDYLWYAEQEDEYIVIGQGQGIVLYQPDAGTASDARRFIASITFDEIDTA